MSDIEERIAAIKVKSKKYKLELDIVKKQLRTQAKTREQLELDRKQLVTEVGNHSMALAWNRWTRKLHRWGAIITLVPLLLVIISGLLLQVKKQVVWFSQRPSKASGKRQKSTGKKSLMRLPPSLNPMSVHGAISTASMSVRAKALRKSNVSIVGKFKSISRLVMCLPRIIGEAILSKASTTDHSFPTSRSS